MKLKILLNELFIVILSFLAPWNWGYSFTPTLLKMIRSKQMTLIVSISFDVRHFQSRDK